MKKSSITNKTQELYGLWKRVALLTKPKSYMACEKNYQYDKNRLGVEQYWAPGEMSTRSIS